MDVQIHKNGWRCYICGKKSRGDWDACPLRMVNARNVEILLLNTLLKRILTPIYFNTLLSAVQERVSDKAGNQKKLTALQASITKVDRAISNLLKIIEEQGSESAAAHLKEREAEKAVLQSQLSALKAEISSSDLKISPEALDKVFEDWRNQVITNLKNDDILAVRLILKEFINRIEVDYDQVRIFYRYPIWEIAGTSKLSTNNSIEAECLEEQQSSLTPEIAASIFEIAPYLAPLPPYQPALQPINPRDFEIYRLHTEEKHTIPSLAKEFGLAEKSIWGICTRMRKRDAVG